LEPYDIPFWGFRYMVVRRKEERSYNARRALSYARKNAVIFLEEYGFIVGREWLYFAMKNVAYLS
jgi:hypothetical protein